MERQQATAKQKTRSLALHKSTLQRLEDSELQRVDGRTRIRIPVGFDDDTAPIFGYEDEP